MTDTTSAAGTVHLLVPDLFDDPTRPSGGNVYDRRLAEGLADLGWDVRVRLVAAAGDAAGYALEPALSAVPDSAIAVVDGLLAASDSVAVQGVSDRLRVVTLAHMVRGTSDEGRMLRASAHVVATSRWAATTLSRLHGLPPGTVTVASPGVDAAPPSAPSESGGRFLVVAAVASHKGHDVLIEALAGLRDRSWTCHCVGSLEVEPRFADGTRALASAFGLAERLRLTGPLHGEDLDARFAAADLLVVPSRDDAYGMVVTEALARGIPVLATDVGGIPEAMGRTAEGELPGMLVAPGDPEALTRRLRHWLESASLRSDLRAAAKRRRGDLPPWKDTAVRVSAALSNLAT